MNRFKKATSDLQSYLGRDTNGLGLLKKVTSIGNEVRTELAKATSDVEAMRVKFDAMQASLLKANVELSQANETILHQQALISQADVTIKTMQLQAAKSEAGEVLAKPIKGGGLTDGRAINDLLIRLKKEMPTPPRMKDSNAGSRIGYNLHDLITSYGGDQMVKLGMMVAASAMMSEDVVIFSSPRYIEIADRHEIDGLLGPVHRFLKWYSVNIDSDAAREIEAAMVGSKADPPSERLSVALSDFSV